MIQFQFNPYNNKVPPAKQQDKPLYKGELGNGVYSNLDISSGQWTDNSGKVIQFDGITLDTVLFVVNQSKNIIKTAIQGRNGTVKEYIADGDYEIQISGIITGSNNLYPQDVVDQLKRILDAPVALRVNSYYLNALAISNIVVESYTIPQEPGGRSQQGFSINCVSDIAVILQINQ